MSRDIEFEVNLQDLHGKERSYYVRGTYIVRYEVILPDGRSYDLDPRITENSDAELWCEEDNNKFISEQQMDEEDSDAEIEEWGSMFE